MVIGVLTPDLNFHRDPLWTKNILKRYGIEYPIILDSDRKIWKAYSNEGWPALYLVDRPSEALRPGDRVRVAGLDGLTLDVHRIDT